MSGALVHGSPDLFGKRPVEGCSDGDVTVVEIDKDEADRVMRAGHYSRSVVWSSSLHFGVMHLGQLTGVLQFGPAMNPASGGKVVEGTQPGEWLELNRMWLAPGRPENCATRAISYALRLVRLRKPAVQWVQSFADERCGKLGAVYQAASFLYCGFHESTFYEVDGEWFHKSMKGRAAVDKRGWGSGPKIARFKAVEHRAVPHVFRQFRYVRFLDQRARKRLLLPVLPYPKPERTHAIDCDMDDDCTECGCGLWNCPECRPENFPAKPDPDDEEETDP